MISILRGMVATAALGAVLLLASGCDSFLEVPNPEELEAEGVDPDRDRSLLSQSAFQSFVSAYGEMAVYVAWFTNEARVGDTFPTRNDFGRRDIPENNAHIEEMWNSLHTSLQFAEETKRRIEAAGNNIDLARAYFTSGFAMILLGEFYCQCTIAESWTVPRGPITSAQIMDSAIVRLTKVREITGTLSGGDATSLGTAAQVGIARAHLQAGRKAEASAAAALVPANFVYNLLHLDDPSNRALGNDIWSYSEARISLVVPPEFIAMAPDTLPTDTIYRSNGGDPRISWVNERRPSQDGVLTFIRQNKYKGWSDVERLASGLEAQYIKIEADANPTAMLDFINVRRAVGKQAAMAPTADLNALMAELMEQKARDFWLEGKRMGDLRRNPTHLPFVLPPGNNYYKTAVGTVGNQTCWPVPLDEILNNRFWPK
jgi:starch-binding outer membrane protein, SusD/RagB family